MVLIICIPQVKLIVNILHVLYGIVIMCICVYIYIYFSLSLVLLKGAHSPTQRKELSVTHQIAIVLPSLPSLPSFPPSLLPSFPPSLSLPPVPHPFQTLLSLPFPSLPSSYPSRYCQCLHHLFYSIYPSLPLFLPSFPFLHLHPPSLSFLHLTFLHHTILPPHSFLCPFITVSSSCDNSTLITVGCFYNITLLFYLSIFSKSFFFFT